MNRFNSREGTIHITLAADRRFTMPLAATLASVAHHSTGDIFVSVLADGVPARDRASVERSVKGNLNIRWVDVDPALTAGVQVPKWVTRATLLRLLIPSIVPAARTLYLDADVLVLDDVSKIWRSDLNGMTTGAVHDAGSPWAAGNGTDWQGLGLRPQTPYFNAGVLLMDVDAWRNQGLADRALEIARSQPLTWADQDALNCALDGEWLPLDRRWNVQTNDVNGLGLAWALDQDGVRAAVARPGILHFTERPKPWQPGCRHSLRDLWYTYLDMTPWTGWRPKSGPATEFIRRTRGSARYLIKGR